jgi:hypothetical protein
MIVPLAYCIVGIFVMIAAILTNTPVLRIVAGVYFGIGMLSVTYIMIQNCRHWHVAEATVPALEPHRVYYNPSFQSRGPSVVARTD